MEGASQIALPVLGIAAVAAVTFYAVSFMELREVRAEANLSHLFQPASFLPFGFSLAVNVSYVDCRQKSFRELEDTEEKESVGGFRSSASTRERRARRKAEKEARK
ncbi:unnamed protein product [Musa hybrid cultivar]